MTNINILTTYHLLLTYIRAGFGLIALMILPIFLISYIRSFSDPRFGNYPWWSLFVILAIGAVAFIIFTTALAELRKRKATDGDNKDTTA